MDSVLYDSSYTLRAYTVDLVDLYELSYNMKVFFVNLSGFVRQIV